MSTGPQNYKAGLSSLARSCRFQILAESPNCYCIWFVVVVVVVVIIIVIIVVGIYIN